MLEGPVGNLLVCYHTDGASVFKSFRYSSSDRRPGMITPHPVGCLFSFFFHHNGEKGGPSFHFRSQDGRYPSSALHTRDAQGLLIPISPRQCRGAATCSTVVLGFRTNRLGIASQELNYLETQFTSSRDSTRAR